MFDKKERGNAFQFNKINAGKEKKARLITATALGGKPLRLIQGCKNTKAISVKLHVKYAEKSMINKLGLLNSSLKSKMLNDVDMGYQILMHNHSSPDNSNVFKYRGTNEYGRIILTLSSRDEYSPASTSINTLQETMKTGHFVSSSFIKKQKWLAEKVAKLGAGNEQKQAVLATSSNLTDIHSRRLREENRNRIDCNKYGIK